MARDLILDLATDGWERMTRDMIKRRAELAASGMLSDRLIDWLGTVGEIALTSLGAQEGKG